jgi:S1-C subfamily serine protease
MLAPDDDDADISASHTSPRPAFSRMQPPPDAGFGRGSPTLRIPKARRNLLGTESGDLDGGTFGRGSPNPFQPVRGGSSSVDDENYSMAGLTNVQELRRKAHGYDPEPMIKACVKVFTTSVQPSYSMPWARGEETRSTGSGFVVSLPEVAGEPEVHPDAAAAGAGQRVIVTNAHVVENFSLIQVRCAGNAEKYVASVLCIGHDVDLALLTVADEEFWEGLPLVALGTGIPRLASEVVAVGFPVGGDDVSATRGVVSRILVGGLTDNLCVQIDAAINPGNSGGPVYDSSAKLVGVAFSGLLNANNVGYIIPLPVVHTFLQNFRRHGSYTGKCSDCFEIQSMENLALRRSFGLHKASGVMLSRVPPESNVHGVLHVRDILMELDGVQIANDGTIQLPGTHDLVRVTFSYLVYRAARGHPLKLTVLRDHQRVDFVVPAMPQPELLLVCKQPLPKPSYLVVGGLVFVPLMCVPRRDPPPSHRRSLTRPPLPTQVAVRSVDPPQEA